MKHNGCSKFQIFFFFKSDTFSTTAKQTLDIYTVLYNFMFLFLK